MKKVRVRPLTEGSTRGSLKGGVQKTTTTKAVRPKAPPPAPKKEKPGGSGAS